jgi:hypothetical protein
MGVEAIAGVAVTVLLAMGGWVWYLSSRLTAADGRITAAETLASGASARAVELARDLNLHKEHVASEYVSRETLKEFTDAVNRLGDRFDTFLMHFVPKP